MISNAFKQAIEDVIKETEEKQIEKIETWTHLRDSWIHHYNTIPSKIIENRTKILMAVRFTECFQSLFWIEWLVMHGGYYQSCRELRSILEGVVQAYYIDMNYRDIDVNGKLAVFREMKLNPTSYGSRLIKKANPPNRKAIEVLYRKLSEFVHGSINHISEVLSHPDSDSKVRKLIVPHYNQYLFEVCCKYSEQVVKYVIEINQKLVDEYRVEL